jgi:hypothetical protein
MSSSTAYLKKKAIKWSRIWGSNGGDRKVAVIWVVAPCSLVEVYRRFRKTGCFQHQGIYRPDVGGSKYCWNIGELVSDYAALLPRGHPSSWQ